MTTPYAAPVEHPLMSIQTMILDNRPAHVHLYEDRIVWEIRGTSWTIPAIVAACTVGVSLLFYRGRRGQRRSIPLRNVTGVEIDPAVVRTKVTVSMAGAEPLVFYCSQPTAETFLSLTERATR